jgi:hypothetical protein
MLASVGQALEWPARFLGNQMRKPPHQRRRVLQKIGKNIGECHGGRNVPREWKKVKGALRMIVEME